MKKKNKNICNIYAENSHIKTVPGYVTDVFRYDFKSSYQTKMHVYHLATRNSNGTTTYYPKGYEVNASVLSGSCNECEDLEKSANQCMFPDDKFYKWQTKQNFHNYIKSLGKNSQTMLENGL